MHGDDVASTGVNTAGQTVTKVVEILLAILKHRQEAKHQKKCRGSQKRQQAVSRVYCQAAR